MANSNARGAGKQTANKGSVRTRLTRREIGMLARMAEAGMSYEEIARAVERG